MTIDRMKTDSKYLACQRANYSESIDWQAPGKKIIAIIHLPMSCVCINFVLQQQMTGGKYYQAAMHISLLSCTIKSLLESFPVPLENCATRKVPLLCPRCVSLWINVEM